MGKENIKIPISKDTSRKKMVENSNRGIFGDIKKPAELKKMKPRIGNKLNPRKFLLPVILIIAVILIGTAYYWYIKLDKNVNIKQEEIPEEIIEDLPAETPVGAEEEVPEETQEIILIQETETGWLNVRRGAGTNYEIITKVYPGESYVLLEEVEEWYKIELKDGQIGWIFNEYAAKQ